MAEYAYVEHQGAETITVDNTDTIKIDIVGSELKYKRNGNDLLIQYSDDVGDVLTLENFFSGSYVETESVFDTIKVLTEEPGVYDDQYIMAANINVEMTSTSFTGVDIKTGGEVVGGYKENIIGTALSDTIDGSSGNDTIDGGLGSDLIIGGKGDDILTGGSDEEINNFRFDSNDGNDTVTDAKSIDILGFKNLLFTDLTFIRNTDDLEISYNTTNKVTVSDFFNSASKIDTVQILDAGDNVIDTKSILADGTINVNLDEFVETYHATSYNEYFTGSGTIDNWVAGKTAKFSSSTTYTLDENGLLISGDNQILITDFTDTYALPTVYVGEDIESVTGKTLTVSGLTDFNGSTMAFNHYEITSTDDVDNLTGGTGNDTIEAGKGNDNIVGYGGADTFVFNTGDGVDTITNANSSSTLRIKDLLSNASFERCEELGFETSLIINYGSGDKIKVIDYFKYVNPDYVKNDNVVTTFVFNDSEGNPVTYDLEWKKSDATGEFAMYNVVNDPAEIIEELPNWVIAPSGDNEINGSENNFDILVGNTGNDTITAGPSGAEMYGNASNDILNGSDVKDYIYGGDDNDTITGNKGDDVIDGGDGNNIFIFNAGDGVDTIENIHSGDEIQINVINATLTYTRNINDLEISYTENDKIILKDFFAAGYVDIETVFDTIKVLNSEQGYNLYSLKDQIIDVTVEDGVPFTGVDIKTASVVTDGYKENITGTDNNDTIDGGYGNDKIIGGAGDDTLSGNKGDDEIYGGAGTDTINGGDGNDLIYGNDGNDTINGDNGDDEIYGGAGTDTINGGDGDDEIHGDDDNDIINGGAGADKIYGDAGDDEIHGGDNNDVIYGGIGNDQIYGDAGNDEIYGGEGEDTINGGDGDDEIHGNTNNDTLTGGLGSDTFIFNAGDGVDTITDAEKLMKL